MKKIGIIGTGIFGTALALTAARAGCDVLCWDRNSDVIDADRKGLSPYDCSPQALEEIRAIKARIDQE